MKPNTGLVLLVWAVFAGLCAVFSFAFANSPGVLEKSLTPMMNVMIQAECLDEAKLDAECDRAGFERPARGDDGHIGLWNFIAWVEPGPSEFVRTLARYMTYAWMMGAVVSAWCGISCIRRPKVTAAS